MNSVQLATAIRKSSLKMVYRAKASHIGSALSIADILAVLYTEIMTHIPENPESAHRDRFILSKGHACVAVYAVLAEVGYFPRSKLDEYGEDFSSLMNHISHHVPGVEFSTGALGHGLPFGVGKALAARLCSKTWRVYVLLSDGELAEGANWEAFLFAAHHRLDNLNVIVDYNKLQSLGTVHSTLAVEPLVDKLAAFGWAVDEIDGHCHEDLREALSRTREGKPRIVVAHTTKGKGISFMENEVLWHYKNPSDEQLTLGLEELSAGGRNA